MTQEPEGGTPSSTIERAEKFLNHTGEQLGVFVWKSRWRFQQAIHSRHEPVSHQDISVSASISPGKKMETEHHAQADHPTSERAEELVNHFGQRVNHWAGVSSLYTRRTLARLREDAEDMFVEAQEMHNEWKGQPTQGKDEQRAFTH